VVITIIKPENVVLQLMELVCWRIMAQVGVIHWGEFL
jgi:hypothetical protein